VRLPSSSEKLARDSGVIFSYLCVTSFIPPDLALQVALRLTWWRCISTDVKKIEGRTLSLRLPLFVFRVQGAQQQRPGLAFWKREKKSALEKKNAFPPQPDWSRWRGIVGEASLSCWRRHTPARYSRMSSTTTNVTL
jgi:hypothetical protein